jgi:small subunit ribosomal protein S9
MEKNAYSHGTGRRKTAVAQVKLSPGNGAIIVNGTPYEERFTRFIHREVINKPLVLTETQGKFSVMVKVLGGGTTGQSGAIAHGIARALVEADEGYKKVLRTNGMLTRDARAKERKKPGLKRARKAPQYTKR